MVYEGTGLSQKKNARNAKGVDRLGEDMYMQEAIPAIDLSKSDIDALNNNKETAIITFEDRTGEDLAKCGSMGIFAPFSQRHRKI